MYTSGALVFVMSVARITVIRLKETPKYLLGEGKDAQLVQDFQTLAAKYNRPCSITLEKLDACGVVQSTHGKTKLSIGELTVHFRGLFATRQIGTSTILIWLSWTLIVCPHSLPLNRIPNSKKGASLSPILRFSGLVSRDPWSNFRRLNL